ncbi:hypothetical protein BGX31_004151 [Mortierella sp. GBA43]|nr:hypothetical protein BGX31_004151 [Mortierella sp. GBA43]
MPGLAYAQTLDKVMAAQVMTQNGPDLWEVERVDDGLRRSHPIWSIDIDTKRTRKQPSIEVLKKYRRHVQLLTYSGHIPSDLYSIHFPVLESLSIHLDHIDGSNERISDAIGQYPALRHIALATRKNPAAFYDNVLWSIPGGLSNLSTLEMRSMECSSQDPQDKDRFRDLLLNLETLSVSWMDLPIYSKPSNGFEKMRDLTLDHLHGSSLQQQLAFIQLCPNLKRLTWGNNTPYERDFFPTDRFVLALKNNTWPELEDLKWIGPIESSQELACIIDGIPRLTSLGIEFTTFPERSMKALRQHFAWLRKFNYESDMDGGKSLGDVLKLCPLLESFSAHRAPVSIIMDTKPWACESSLKVFNVWFNVRSPKSTSFQPVTLFARLSRLRQLESLDLSFLWDEPPLDFRLGEGLEQLSTLTRLEKLELRTGVCVRRWTMQDVDWMINHWRRLATLRVVRYGGDDEKTETLLARFREAEISADMVTSNERP